jgi:hypothetical protein
MDGCMKIEIDRYDYSGIRLDRASLNRTTLSLRLRPNLCIRLRNSWVIEAMFKLDCWRRGVSMADPVWARGEPETIEQIQRRLRPNG